MKPTHATLIALALAGSVLAQEPSKPEPPPRPPEAGEAGRDARPPLPPGEREPGPRGAESREPRERPERPPFPPPGGERRPEEFPGQGERGRRSEGERRTEMPGFPGGERSFSQRLKPTPYLGVATSAAPPVLAAQLGLPEGFGLVVDEVLPDSPAANAGVQRHDVLKQFNEQQLVDPAQLAALVRSLGKDAEASVTLLRKGQEQKLTIKIGEKNLPERRIEEFRGGSFGMPDLRRGGGEMNRAMPDFSRELQERMRQWQERLRNYERETKEWQERVRQWQQKREGDLPAPPQLPQMEMQRPRPSGANEPERPPTPGGPPRNPSAQEPGEKSGTLAHWETNGARVTIRDRDGEAELTVRDGHRRLTVRNPAGEVVLSEPVDTAEERQKLPEPVRGKLEELEKAPQSPRGEARSRPAQPQPEAPQRPRERDVQ